MARLIIFGVLFLVALVATFTLRPHDRTAEPGAVSSAEHDPSQRDPALPPDVAVEAVPPAPLPPLAMRLDGTLTDAANGDGFGETIGYRRLLALVAKDATSVVPLEPPPLLDYAATIAHPDDVRGESRRVHGVVVDLWPVKLTTPLLDREDVYRGVIVQPDGTEGVAFDLVDRPSDITPRRDAVELTGVVYRTVRYEDRDGNAREVPYLIAKVITPLQTKPPFTFRTLLDPKRWLAVLLTATVGLVLWQWRRALRGTPRPKSVGFDRLFRERLRQSTPRRDVGPRIPK